MNGLCKRLPRDERAYVRRVVADWKNDDNGRFYCRLWGMERHIFVLAEDAFRKKRVASLVQQCESEWIATRKGARVLVAVGTDKAVNAELDRVLSQFAAYQRRQARVRAAPGFYLPEHIAVLWEIQGGRCYFSGDPLGPTFELGEYQIDHLWPLASSMFRISFGTNWPTNLALVSRRVNRMKGATSADDFISRVRRTKALVLRPTKERRKIDEERHERFREFMVRECSADENDWLG